MEQLQRDKAAAVAAVGRLEAELADARREREAARGAAAAAEARLSDIDRLKREKAAALAAVQRLEVDAAAARSQARPAACRQARCGPQLSARAEHSDVLLAFDSRQGCWKQRAWKQTKLPRPAPGQSPGGTHGGARGGRQVAALENRVVAMEQLQRDKAAALAAVQRLEVDAAAGAASLAAARSQVPLPLGAVPGSARIRDHGGKASMRPSLLPRRSMRLGPPLVRLLRCLSSATREDWQMDGEAGAAGASRLGPADEGCCITCRDSGSVASAQTCMGTLGQTSKLAGLRHGGAAVLATGLVPRQEHTGARAAARWPRWRSARRPWSSWRRRGRPRRPPCSGWSPSWPPARPRSPPRAPRCPVPPPRPRLDAPAAETGGYSSALLLLLRVPALGNFCGYGCLWPLRALALVGQGLGR